MTDFAGRVRRAYSRGGVAEVVRASRSRIAAIVDPGPGAADVPPSSQMKAADPRPSALGVDRESAIAWFEGRHATYVRLASSVAQYVSSDDLILDVGANIGYFTRVLSETVGFSGTAHLFEPIPHLANMIEGTLVDTPVTVIVHTFGLSDEEAEVPIFVATSGNLGWNTIVAEKSTQDMTEISILVKPFNADSLAKAPALIKIDVEGAEHRVLNGMMAALAEWSPKPVILCEVGWGTGHPDWEAEMGAFQAVMDLGYETRDLDHHPVDVRALTRTTDVLFIPCA